MNVISTNIPDNEAYSGMVDLGNNSLVAIELPETFNTTTITFQSKAKLTEDDGTHPAWEDCDNVYDDTGTELSATVAAGRIVGFKADKASVLAPLRYLRIRSGTSASPVNINPGGVIRFLVK